MKKKIISLVLIIVIISVIIFILVMIFGINAPKLDTSIKKENVDMWTQKKNYKNSVAKIKKELSTSDIKKFDAALTIIHAYYWHKNELEESFSLPSFFEYKYQYDMAIDDKTGKEIIKMGEKLLIKLSQKSKDENLIQIEILKN